MFTVCSPCCTFFSPGSKITNDKELRMVMVGKTGIGKSATGNTILGEKLFKSKFSAKSMTVDCAKGRAVVDGQPLAVIDTPGLFDTRFDEEQTAKDLSRCIAFASPGPHVFLVVVRLGRFTDEEKQTVQMIQKIFGEAADKYSMVLFTGGDLLEGTTIEEFLSDSEDLQELVNRCNGEYHVFNNQLRDESQVRTLLHKIRNIVEKNGGSHYTNEMFQEAEREIEEEKRRILKEKEEQIRKEREEIERKLREQHESEMKELNERHQAEKEKDREEMERQKNELKAAHDKRMREEAERLQAEHARKARSQAENQNRRKRCVIL